jgi:peptidoglycan/xylan/chitin deacetylase (PgdA/CDA1 family)
LEVLRGRGAPATFFVDARRARAHPESLALAVADGHEVGFHCHDHVRHSECSEAELRADTEEGLAALRSLDLEPRAWRAPWGIVTEVTRRLAAEHGLELWGWSFDSHDWRGDGSERMLEALAATGDLGGGEVVLMHDGIGPGARRDGCEETVRLTTALLDLAEAAGLTPTTVSDLGAAAAGR